LNILLTRPLLQVSALQSMVNDNGHQAILFPTLENAVIFISANAVEYGITILEKLNLQRCQIFAVGAATANRITHHGFKVDAYPNPKASSEALLSLNEVQQLQNKNILIFRGRGGRETLKEGLVKENNQVEYVEVYERVECEAAQLHKDSLLQLSNDQDFITTITSVESLSAMVDLIRKIDGNFLKKLLKTPLIVLSDRIAVFAKSVGFLQVYVALQPNDSAIVEKIQQIKLEKYNTLDK